MQSLPFLLSRNMNYHTLKNEGFCPNEVIHFNTLYYVTDIGLYKSDVHFPKIYKTQLRNEKKLWDCPLFSLMANSFGQIALSAGDEGLFELNNFNAEYLDNKPVNISGDSRFLLESNIHMTDIPPIYHISKKHSDRTPFYRPDYNGQLALTL